VYKLFDEFKNNMDKRRKTFDEDQVLSTVDKAIDQLEFEVRTFCK